MKYPRIDIAGVNAMMVYFADHPSRALTHRIMAVTKLVQLQFSDALINFVPSYVTLLVIVDHEKLSPHDAKKLLDQCIDTSIEEVQIQSQTHTLPVLYTKDYCPDLSRVAQQCGISIETLIQQHTSRAYHVYALGFAPGFAYLGELDECLRLPRLETPRKKVPAGAVAIAESQTAVYPMDSPGGWHILGLCPLPLFNLNSTPSTPFSVGDYVQFEAVSEAQFLQLGGELTFVEDCSS